MEEQRPASRLKVTIDIPAMSRSVVLQLGSEATGQLVLVTLTDRLQLAEETNSRKWFGLMYRTKSGENGWVTDMDQPINLLTDDSAPDQVQLCFMIRLFPADPVREIRQEETLFLIYRQVQQQVIQNPYGIRYLLDGLMWLGAYAMQSDQVDIDDLVQDPSWMSWYLPAYAISFEADPGQLEERLKKLHRDLVNLSSIQAMKEFLSVAALIGAYGQVIFRLGDPGWNNLLLGIGPEGLSLYQRGEGPDEFKLAKRHAWDQVTDCQRDCGKLQISFAEEESAVFRGRVKDIRQIVQLVNDYKQYRPS